MISRNVYNMSGKDEQKIDITVKYPQVRFRRRRVSYLITVDETVAAEHIEEALRNEGIYPHRVREHAGRATWEGDGDNEQLHGWFK